MLYRLKALFQMAHSFLIFRALEGHTERELDMVCVGGGSGGYGVCHGWEWGLWCVSGVGGSNVCECV